jgi:hypothetical protein
VVDLGADHTLAFAMLEGRGRSSGVDVALPAAQVLKWRDGLCVHLKRYERREDALKDLDVSEDVLEPIVP